MDNTRIGNYTVLCCGQYAWFTSLLMYSEDRWLRYLVKSILVIEKDDGIPEKT